MIEIRKIEIQTLEHFDNHDNSLGFLNELENIDLRVQIKNNNISGYYLMFKGEKIEISSNGKFKKYPSGMYDEHKNLLLKLVK